MKITWRLHEHKDHMKITDSNLIRPTGNSTTDGILQISGLVLTEIESIWLALRITIWISFELVFLSLSINIDHEEDHREAIKEQQPVRFAIRRTFESVSGPAFGGDLSAELKSESLMWGDAYGGCLRGDAAEGMPSRLCGCNMRHNRTLANRMTVDWKGVLESDRWRAPY